MAFPELLDTHEAEGDVNDPALNRALTGVDFELIEEAKELVRRDMNALEAANPGMQSDSQHYDSMGSPVDGPVSEWLALDEKLDTLQAPYEDKKSYETISLYLGTPERIIDCGEAGRIDLYTSAQVQRAQEESGVSDHLEFLRRQAAAPELARRIVERAKLIEQKTREAEEAHIASITTKIEDLPPLPMKEHDWQWRSPRSVARMREQQACRADEESCGGRAAHRG